MRWFDDWMNGRMEAVRSLYQMSREESLERQRQAINAARQAMDDEIAQRQARIDENFDRALAYFKEQKAIHALVDRAPWNQINAGK